MSVELHIEGLILSGWTHVSISRLTNDLAGEFELGLTNKTLNQLPVKVAQKCLIKYKNQTLLTGYIDVFNCNYSADEQQVSVSGRDVTSVLVDSSIESVGFSQQTAPQIITQLINPFGIALIDQSSVKFEPIENFQTNPGDQIIDVIKRLVKSNNINLSTDGLGNLVFASQTPVTSNAILETGQNILSAEGSFDITDQFSHITVLGQAQSDDFFPAESSQSAKAEIKEPNVLFYKPLVLVADDNATQSDVKKRAKFEKEQRRKRATQINYSVCGWESSEGKVWQAGQAVYIKDSVLNIDDNYQIASVSLSLDEGGQKAQLIVQKN